MNIEEVIGEVKESGFNAPHIFTSLLNKEDVFTYDSEILSAVFLSREYYTDLKETSNISYRAKILIATSQGVVFAEEGVERVCKDNCGYKIKFIPYHKIASLELDFCLLLGILKISSGSSSESEISFGLNTAKYERVLLEFIDVVHKQLKV